MEKENDKLKSIISEQDLQISKSKDTINILKLQDFDFKKNKVKCQNAFNQTPIHLLQDKDLINNLNQFRVDTYHYQNKSINTEHIIIKDNKNITDSKNKDLIKLTSNTSNDHSSVFNMYTQYSHEVMLLKSDLEDILRRVNSVNTNDVSDVENLKDYFNQTTQSTIRKMISTISTLKNIESNDADFEKIKNKETD